MILGERRRPGDHVCCCSEESPDQTDWLWSDNTPDLTLSLSRQLSVFLGPHASHRHLTYNLEQNYVYNVLLGKISLIYVIMK